MNEKLRKVDAAEVVAQQVYNVAGTASCHTDMSIWYHQALPDGAVGWKGLKKCLLQAGFQRMCCIFEIMYI